MGDSKIIPITIVTRFLDQNTGTRAKTPTKGKTRSVPATGSNSSEPKNLLPENISKVVAVEKDVAGASKAFVPYTKTGALRNEWTRAKSQRPKTNRENIHFKETYEKLKRLGLLKPRLGNCCIGMTSPSGKYKFEDEKAAPRKNGVGPAPLDSLKKPSKKLSEIKSKFLQNNVVVKVQHFYESQGKEMPDDLKILANGRSLRRRPDVPDARSSYQANQRRFQLYPCTSPSQTQFTRNFKNVK